MEKDAQVVFPVLLIVHTDRLDQAKKLLGVFSTHVNLNKVEPFVPVEQALHKVIMLDTDLLAQLVLRRYIRVYVVLCLRCSPPQRHPLLHDCPLEPRSVLIKQLMLVELLNVLITAKESVVNIGHTLPILDQLTIPFVLLDDSVHRRHRHLGDWKVGDLVGVHVNLANTVKVLSFHNFRLEVHDVVEVPG